MSSIPEGKDGDDAVHLSERLTDMARASYSAPKTFKLWLVTILAVVAYPAPAFSKPIPFRLAPIFRDNVVLQQQRDIPVWGRGKPGTNVVLRTTWGKQTSAVISNEGSWSLRLTTPKAGGPYTLIFSYGDSTKVLRNVLIGEVWVCSGQSNMAMPLEGWPPTGTVANSAGEISRAQFPLIRLFSVPRAYQASPSDICEGTWQECSPRNVRGFSATAYFFGTMLYEALKVPIGLINTSVGSAPIEAWMSREALASFKEYVEPLKRIEESKRGPLALNRWIMKHPAIGPIRAGDQSPAWNGLRFQDDSCSARDYDDRAWSEIALPKLWERASIGDFDGAVWFRKSIAIPPAWIGTRLVLQLGPIDDMDETYVNGQLVGSHLDEGLWTTDRVYAVPETIVRDSVLQIATRVLDTRGSGGIYGDEKKLCVYQDSSASRISLAGTWKYLPVAEYRANVFYVYGTAGREFDHRPKPPIQISTSTPTSLYNGMVSPLVPFSIRGVIWYQGETDAGLPELYRKLFPAMIGDWRKAFHCGEFPFYFVQIAPYDYGDTIQSQLLREAQLQTLSVRNTGMAVTLDIGNPKNIHPADKQDVGRRLALCALAKTYGKTNAFSGPLCRWKIQGRDRIVLTFQHADGGLYLKNLGAGNGFQIAGRDRQFKDAKVTIRGNKLIVSHPDILHPQAVRYAFSNTAEATLFNGEGLPAPSFRTDTWKH